MSTQTWYQTRLDHHKEYQGPPSHYYKTDSTPCIVQHTLGTENIYSQHCSFWIFFFTVFKHFSFTLLFSILNDKLPSLSSSLCLFTCYTTWPLLMSYPILATFTLHTFIRFQLLCLKWAWLYSWINFRPRHSSKCI